MVEVTQTFLQCTCCVGGLTARKTYNFRPVFSLEIANQVVQIGCKLPKVVLANALYGLGQLLISLVSL